MKEFDGYTVFETQDGGMVWSEIPGSGVHYLSFRDSDGCETAEGMTKVEMAGLVAQMAELVGAPEDALWLLKQHVISVQMEQWHYEVGKDLSEEDLEVLDRMSKILYRLPFRTLVEKEGQTVLDLFRAAQGEV